MKYYKLYTQVEGFVGRDYPYKDTVFDEKAAKHLQEKNPDLKLHETVRPEQGVAWTVVYNKDKVVFADAHYPSKIE